MKEEKEILIIDDIPNAAKDFEDLINAKYNLKTISTETPSEAIEITKNNPIKVAVIDQAMPLMKGTDLYKELKKINPYIKALMLTGEASIAEIQEAMGYGFEGLLAKEKINELPDKVFSYYVQFEVDLLKNKSVQEKKSIFTYRPKIFSPQKIEYFLNTIDLLEKRFSFENNWKTLIELNAGQTLEIEDSKLFQETITFNTEINSTMFSEFGLSDQKINLFKHHIKNEVNSRFSTTSEATNSVNTTTKKNFSLPSQTEDLNKPYVVKRIHEVKPIFQKFRATIIKKCSCCNNIHLFPILFYKQSSEFITRQIDFYNTGEKKTIDTGSTYF